MNLKTKFYMRFPKIAISNQIESKLKESEKSKEEILPS